MDALLTLFGEAFDDPDTYGGARPDRSYTERLLSNPDVIALDHPAFRWTHLNADKMI